MEKELLKRVHKVEVYYLESESGEADMVTETASPDTRRLEENDRRVRYFESDICEGMFFPKFMCDVEYDGKLAGLSKLEFGILWMLNEENGDADIGDVKSQCWPGGTSDTSFSTIISKLNKKLEKIGVPKTVAREDERLLFL